MRAEEQYISFIADNQSRIIIKRKKYKKDSNKTSTNKLMKKSNKIELHGKKILNMYSLEYIFCVSDHLQFF